jgi:hypothetical protein
MQNLKRPNNLRTEGCFSAQNVFLFIFQVFKTYDYYIWVQNLVSYFKERSVMEDIWKQRRQ